MGCLFLILLGVSPRLAVVTLWLLTDWVERAFGDSWILPLAGLDPVAMDHRPVRGRVCRR